MIDLPSGPASGASEPISVKRLTVSLPVSAGVLADAEEIRAAFNRWTNGTPEDRARWTEEARQRRAAVRAAAERTPLTLDALLENLGFSRGYAEHLVQPYCLCEDGSDGWEYCEHARDEGLAP